MMRLLPLLSTGPTSHHLVNILCRHCRDPETLAHVLGSCPRGALLRNPTHHVVAVRSEITEALKSKGWLVAEEVHCVSQEESCRRLNILAYNEVTTEGVIVDPTIRFENSKQQPQLVHEEKRKIYEPCTNYLKEKYGLNSISVIGLMIDARGPITSMFENFMKQFGINSNLNIKL